jgi:F-type H+-transporting ATPase subunit delta
MEPRPDKKTAKKSATPYARAAFEIAREENIVADWEEKLFQLAEVMQDPELKKIPHDPRLKPAALESIMDKVMDELEGNETQRKFVKLLIKDKKLSLLPWIHKAFVEERRKAEAALTGASLAEVTIVSAKELTPGQLLNLKNTLKKRFNVSSEPEVKTDPDLIGGVKIIIGDRVYDQTIKGQLERMRKHLKGP